MYLPGLTLRRTDPAALALGLLFLLAGCARETTAVPAVASVAAVPAPVNLYFDTDSAAPGADASGRLDGIVAYAKAHPAARVSVSGYNDPMGANRALAIRNVLVGRGVSEDNVDRDKSIATTGAAGERESRVEVSVR
jgi:cytochrome c oxidase subunit II